MPEDNAAAPRRASVCSHWTSGASASCSQAHMLVRYCLAVSGLCERRVGENRLTREMFIVDSYNDITGAG